MRKLMKLLLFGAAILGVLWVVDVKLDRDTLNDGLIRMHIVANSDSQEDQNLKLQVRDAVTAYLTPILENMPSREEAEAYLREHLEDLKAIAQQVLSGTDQQVTVKLEKEAFPKREYDTFTLPAGTYEALRFEIGAGEGHNWWCVVFPQLCLPATAAEFDAQAAGAGFSDTLTGAVEGDYPIRFFLLDCLGKLENWLGSRG